MSEHDQTTPPSDDDRSGEQRLNETMDSNVASDKNDEGVQTVGSNMSAMVIFLGIIGFIIGLDSRGIGSILICSFSALVIVGGFILNQLGNSETVKPIWRMRFSIRTMLIVVALISVVLGGTRLWVLWNTKYTLEAYLFVDEDFEKNLETAEDWYEQSVEHAEIFGYEFVDLGPDPRKYNTEFMYPSISNADIKYRPFVGSWYPLRFGAAYSVGANYFTIDKRQAELKEQIKAVVDGNPNLKFPKLKIVLFRFDSGSKTTIAEVDPRKLEAP